jgi:hypothetical protein
MLAFIQLFGRFVANLFRSRRQLVVSQVSIVTLHSLGAICRRRIMPRLRIGPAALLPAVLVASIAVVSQSAQAYPDRPIKLVVPSPAGGPPDQIARLISDKMAAALGQPVIVENRTGGAGGIIGAKSVAAAEPDGLPRSLLRFHTLR